ncbi:MAG: phenylalanine--tRNA ligase subunit beta, partial [Brevinematia bacterium]
MKFPFTWLNDFIELEKILDKEKQDVFGVAEKLTKVGVEVEEVEKLGFYDGNVVVAEVDEISPHPTKPQLLVCKINVGSDEGRIVVTSDVTVKKGQKVVYCFPGTILVKSNTLVDIMSFENINSYGMLLSLEELGIEPRSETVWKINSDWGIGSDLISNMLPRFIREEYVFTVKVPSNRADVLSVLGIARELSAIYGIPLRQLPTYKFSEDQSIKPEIVIQDGRCLRYCSRVVKKVKVRESSDIVKIRLLLSGLRPINNIVDITNYVMLAVGQPMHAFDYDKLSGRRIVVRASKEGERIVTLDGREIVLKEDTLVIADNEKPVAIAGVIGGEETRITENTTSVLFESAYFDYNTIRKTVKELGISTESSLRFSRDLGFYTTDLAINLAVGMIGEGKVSSFVDVRGSGNGALKEEVIKTSFSAIRERIGCEVPNERIKSILTFLGFELQTKGDEVIVKVPPYRKDVFIEEDIVEEVARIFGYDNVPSTIPRIEKNPEIPSNVLKLEQVVRSNLVAQGLTEVMNFSFISEKDAELFMLGKDLLVKVFNPMIAEDNTLRPMLLVNLLRTVKRNVNNGFRNLSIFEIGKVFTRVGEVFSEDKNVCIVLCGKRDE